MISQGKTRHLQQMRQNKSVLYYQLRPENNYSNVDYIHINGVFVGTLWRGCAYSSTPEVKGSSLPFTGLPTRKNTDGDQAVIQFKRDFLKLISH